MAVFSLVLLFSLVSGILFQCGISTPWWSEMMLSYTLTLTLFIFVIQQSMSVLAAWVIRVGAVCIILRLCCYSVLFNLAFSREFLLESMLMSPMITIFEVLLTVCLGIYPDAPRSRSQFLVWVYIGFCCRAISPYFEFDGSQFTYQFSA